MGGPLDVTELDFAGGFGRVDIDREQNLEEFVVFVPVHPGVKSDSRGGAEADALLERGFAEVFGDFDGDANGASFDNLEGGAFDEVNGGFLGEKFGVPRIPEWGAVVEDLE